MSNGAVPLTLADGRVIMPRLQHEPMVVPQITHPAEINVPTTRKLSDLPESPRVMNAMAAVVAYKLYGLSDADVAEAIGVDVARVERTIATASYRELRNAVVAGVLDSESTGVRDMFRQHARPAVLAMVEALNDGRRSDRIAAAKDILDRAGHRPADVVEHRHRMDGGLTIEVIRRDATPQIPTIDMEIADGTDASE